MSRQASALRAANADRLRIADEFERTVLGLVEGVAATATESNAAAESLAAASGVAAEQIACETDRAAGVIRVRAADTGRGVAPDQLERIFEPFVQLDRQRTHASQQGVGLVLAISRDLARGMGGELTAESMPGAGRTFTLTLPLSGSAVA